MDGDDEDAKKIVAGLVQDLGCGRIDCRDPSSALILDLLVPSVIKVDRRYNYGRSSSWELLG